MGLKGGAASLTPAQLEVQKFAVAEAAKAYNKWQPIQQQFISQTQRDQGALESIQRGQAAGSARTTGTQATDALLSRDTQVGAKAGSGRYATAFQAGTDATAGGAGRAVTDATGQAKARYLTALQQGLDVTQNTKQQALGGLSAAGRAEAAEAGAQQEGINSQAGGIGKLVGLAGSQLVGLAGDSEFLKSLTGSSLGSAPAVGVHTAYNQTDGDF